jgi:signal transduction histidine kinase
VLVLTVIPLSWLGYRASQEWRRSAHIAAELRVNGISRLLITALIKDMSGFQESVLIPLQSEKLSLHFPEITEHVSRAFARFPYPESVFVWTAAPHSVALFNRSDRPPVWEKTTRSTFPVTVIRDSPIASTLAAQSLQFRQHEIGMTTFETVIAGAPYQVVARLFQEGGLENETIAVVGFTVNLVWVNTEYFKELLSQIEGIGGTGGRDISLAILDDHGQTVTQTRAAKGNAATLERKFPFTFFDSSSVPIAGFAHMPLKEWTARVGIADDPLIGAIDDGSRRTLMFIVLAAVTSLISMLFALRSVRTNFELLAMKADFVAMVSHELKTPLTSIRLVGETLSKGWCSSQDVANYGVVISREAGCLTRLVENLLRVSRMTDSKISYRVACVNITELLTSVLSRMQPQIQQGAFDIAVRVDAPAAEVLCDREAVGEVLENVIVNAMKYSDEARAIDVTVSESGNVVKLAVRDRGIGIVPEDVPNIFQPFFRGRNADVGGSGLGLAIASRIIKDHDGEITVNSSITDGTLVTIALPKFRGIDESKNIDS